MKLGIQLFSLRDEAAADFEGTIKSLSEIGYEGVELAGTYDLTFEQIGDILKKYNMKAVSAHISGQDIESEETMKGYQSLGLKFAALNGLGIGSDPVKVKNTVGYATELGKKCHPYGIMLTYHNHSYEFAKIGDEYGLQVFYDEIDNSVFQCEPDVAWVYDGGADPVEFITRNKDIIPLVHIKDYVGVHGEDSFKFVPAGQGVVGIDKVVEASENCIADWLIVEQDQPTPGKTALECAAESAEYLKKLLNK